MSPQAIYQAIKSKSSDEVLTFLRTSAREGGKERGFIFQVPTTPPWKKQDALSAAIATLDDPLMFFLDVGDKIQASDNASNNGHGNGELKKNSDDRSRKVAIERRVAKGLAGMCCIALSILRQQDIPQPHLNRFFSCEADVPDKKRKRDRKGKDQQSNQEIIEDGDGAEKHKEEGTKRQKTAAVTSVTDGAMDSSAAIVVETNDVADALVTTIIPTETTPSIDVTLSHSAAKQRLAQTLLQLAYSDPRPTTSCSPIVPFYLRLALELDIYEEEFVTAADAWMNANSDSYDFASGLGRYAYQLASSGSFPECAVIIREFLSGSLLKCLNPPSRFHNIEPDQIMTALDMMVNADDVQNVAEALMVNQKGFGTFEKVLQDQLQELIRMFLFRIEETCFKLWSDLEESLNLNPGTRLKSDNSNPQSLTRYSNHLCTLAFRLKFVKSNSELLALFPAGSAGSRRSKVFWLITEVQRIVQEWTFGHISTDSEPESDESQLKASAVKEIDSILELLGMIVNGVDDRFSNCLSKHVLSMLLETCDRSDGELLKNAMLWVAEEFASQFKLEPFLVAAKESVGDGGGSGLKGRDKKMDSKKHLPVYQGRYPVTYVDDAEKLLLVLALLRKPSPVDVADPASPGGSSLAAIVSLDCEWAPDVLSLTTASSATVPASILQMGIEDADGNRSIFVLALDCLPAADVELMLTGLFNSKKIKKLGFGLEQDISKLGVLYPQIPRTLKYLKDLSTVPKNELAKFKTPENNVKHGGKIGLADLCHWVLKKRLSKSARISNWNRRPLKEQQIQYAANDVAVLLDIYALLRTP